MQTENIWKEIKLKSKKIKLSVNQESPLEAVRTHTLLYILVRVRNDLGEYSSIM